MPLNTDGFDDLMGDITAMSSAMDLDGAGAPVGNVSLRTPRSPSIRR